MQVTFLPNYKSVTITESMTVMEIMRKHGVEMDFACGGHGVCGKCKVLVTKGNQSSYSEAELKCLDEEERQRGYRLACKFTVTEDTCVIIEDAIQEASKVQLESGKIVDSDGRYEVVFDIGTTTIEVAFLASGTLHPERVVRVNPQRTYGMDVMSRLSYAAKGSDYESLLQKVVVGAMNETIHDFCNKNLIAVEQLHRILVMGNTTMIYLLLNRPVTPLLKPPFRLEFEAFTGNASEYGFQVSEECQLVVPPLLHGYVGSDTLGCILATGIWDRKGTYAIMDIGTNGELAVSQNGRITVCSTAAGPAFEGASIVQGMRAQKGAIYAVERKGIQDWKVQTIGEGEAKGICGSGLLDAVAVLLECGLMDSTGFMKKQKIELDSEGNVSIWQEDIRQLQLAKAAIRAGFEVLLEEARILPEQIEKIYITGAFGAGINVNSAIRCGLFPKLPAETYEYMDNGSLFGGIQILQSAQIMEQAIEIAQSVQHIELAENDKFHRKFINNMDFNN